MKPTLVIHGTADRIVPYSHGQEVFRRVTVVNKRFVSVEGAGHCDFQSFLGEKYIPLLVDFILSPVRPCDMGAKTVSP